ncbi:MAG: ABC transporter ATP-binding protein [Alphaproteobacteria bacterium]|nr:ABC transporter ATP-binding protein [Alphaproteobacteria bacterium]
MIPDGLLWPPDRSRELLEALALRSGRGQELAAGQRADLDQLGVDLHSVHAFYDTLPALVLGAAPAALSRFDVRGGRQLLGLLRGPDLLGRVTLLGVDGRPRRVPARLVVASLREGIEASQAPAVEALLEAAQLPAGRRARARERLLSDRLRGRPLGGGVLVRAAPHGPVRAQLREAGLLPPLLAAVAGRALNAVLVLAGWTVIGKGALTGQVAPGWVAGWALLLLTALLLGQWTSWQQGRAALRAGTWVKQTLLRGAMKTEPEAWRASGAGGALARVQESQAIEDLVISGGLQGLLAAADLLAAAWVLLQVPGGLSVLGVLLLFAGLTVAGALRLRRLQGHWTEHRRHLTELLVERMLGHRTRLAQAPPQRWHDGEDEALAGYHGASQALDDHRVAVSSGLTGGFAVAGLCVVGLGFAAGGASPAALAVTLGGFLLAQGAFASMGASLEGLVGASVSWREVGPLLRGARVPPELGQSSVSPMNTAKGEVLLRAEDLRFAFPGRPPVLRGLDLELRAGERVLLTGASGGGKSTLASLLTGLRRPDGGLLLLGGLDPATLGPERWRDLAVAAPQFHENHVFENSLAFNLLLGREWPASAEEQQQARQLCEQLGLGELLARMPAGLGQIVGASGWQLSHGERSRVFLARALLQGARLIVLDESFAALDPQTLGQCLDVVERWDATVVVVGHP